MRLRARSAALAAAILALSPFMAPAANAAAPGDLVAASSLPALLRVAAETTTPAYERALFEHWVDADGDGCNTRYEVLIEESTSPVTVGSGCSLTGGTWVSPYDGFLATSPTEIEIDHVVALAEAWRSGASAWSNAQRLAFANDLEVPYALSVSSTAANQAKSDKDPAEWLPGRTEYTCEYVIGWTLGKYRWSLAVDDAEHAAIAATLSGACGATTVTLPAVMVPPPTDDPVDPGETVITPFPAGVTRLAGPDRYATAIAASQRFAPNVPVVFVATGANFPDALSAAAAAAHLGGPLLLTSATSLRSDVAAEIRRLAPTRIYVVGGSAVLGDGVLTSLASIAPTERLAGPTRYATGLSVIAESFTSSAHAVIATGRTFPDALAATGVAGASQAPVVLVDGALPALPTSTLTALSGLGVSSIVIAGGTSAISAGIESQLKASGYAVSRYGGTTRYETAALLNDTYFPPGSSSTTFLATGLNFPDALAAAAIAGRLAAPLYVTLPDCTPSAVHDSIAALGASARVVMGGTGIVSDAAAANTECVAPPPPPPPPPPSVPPNPGDSVNCSDFSTWSQAQEWFLRYYPYYGDVARLDGDNDGIACESLPGAP